MSRCQRMAIVILSAHQAATADMQAAPPCSGRILPQQTPVILAAPGLTRTRWTGHLARPTVCRHTTRWRTSCGRLNPAAGAVCGGMTGSVRHCGRDDTDRSATSQSPPPSPSQLQKLHHCWYWPDVLHPAPWLWGKHIAYRRLPAPYTYIIGSIRRCRQSAALLRPGPDHAHRMMYASV